MERIVRIKGIAYALLSSASFGLSPCFTLLLLGEGFTSFEVLAYRWGIATLFLVGCGLWAGRRFLLPRRMWGVVGLLSLLRAATSFSLIVAYANIATGAASIIHFMYPLAVAAAMILFFGERRSVRVLAAIALSVAGTVLLSSGNTGPGTGNAVAGMTAATVSIFTYGAYIVGMRKSRAAELDSTVLTCYVMGIGALLFILGGVCTDGMRLETGGREWLWILGLALPATALSNLTLVKAIRAIGPTLTALFGAMEPLTAVAVGIALFGERLTPWGIAGIAAILAAVGMTLVPPRSREPQSTN